MNLNIYISSKEDVSHLKCWTSTSINGGTGEKTPEVRLSFRFTGLFNGNSRKWMFIL